MGSLTGFGAITLDQAKLVGLNPDVFGAVTRAAELGIPIGGNRIREFVTGALDNGGLPVSKASAAISVNAGQARLRDIAIRAEGADLKAVVNLDLGDGMLDALLTLDPPSQAAEPGHPTLMVALKGTLPAPTRSVDTGLLTGWLTLRELEQQSKQIEAMEKAAREAAAAAGSSEPTASAEPVAPSNPESPPPLGAASATNTIPGEARAPSLPPPVTIPARPKPRVVPRRDHVPSAGGTAQPANPPLPRLLGAEN
jgi:large subunit ribosomal protein L24